MNYFSYNLRISRISFDSLQDFVGFHRISWDFRGLQRGCALRGKSFIPCWEFSKPHKHVMEHSCLLGFIGIVLAAQAFALPRRLLFSPQPPLATSALCLYWSWSMFTKPCDRAPVKPKTTYRGVPVSCVRTLTSYLAPRKSWNPFRRRRADNRNLYETQVPYEIRWNPLKSRWNPVRKYTKSLKSEYR